MAQTAKMVHAVDWGRGDANAGAFESSELFLQNLKLCKIGDWQARDHVVAHIGRSEDVCPAFRQRYFDMAFLDGAHDKDSVLRDTRHVLLCLKDDGIIAFDDYDVADVREAAKQVMDAFCMRVNPAKSMMVSRSLFIAQLEVL